MESFTQIFKALSDSTRLRILCLLLDKGELCVCDLIASLDIPQSTVSRHLATLRNAGLVRGARRGVWMYYKVTEDEGLGSAILDDIYQYSSGLEEITEDNRRYAQYLSRKSEDACTSQVSTDSF